MAFPKGKTHPGKGTPMCQGKNKRCRPYESLFHYSRQRARSITNHRKFGRKWYISYAQFLEFTRIKHCHYCGAGDLWPLPFGPNNEKGEYRFRSNLDRKNNALEYTKDNCVVCCPTCNFTKCNLLTYEEMVAVGDIRRKNRDKEKK
jgi:hypothetical protein